MMQKVRADTNRLREYYWQIRPGYHATVRVTHAANKRSYTSKTFRSLVRCSLLFLICIFSATSVFDVASPQTKSWERHARFSSANPNQELSAVVAL